MAITFRAKSSSASNETSYEEFAIYFNLDRATVDYLRSQGLSDPEIEQHARDKYKSTQH